MAIVRDVALGLLAAGLFAPDLWRNRCMLATTTQVIAGLDVAIHHRKNILKDGYEGQARV